MEEKLEKLEEAEVVEERLCMLLLPRLPKGRGGTGMVAVLCRGFGLGFGLVLGLGFDPGYGYGFAAGLTPGCCW